METINLNKKEVSMLEQSIGIPIDSFGGESFKSSLGHEYDQALLVYKKIEESAENETNLTLSKQETVLLLKSFLFARDICDPIDFPTLTGFSWKESDNFLVKIINFISKS